MSNPKENKFIYADPGKCLGCKGCEIACALAHADCTLEEAVLNKLQLKSRTTLVNVEGTVVPIQCRQCEDAPCAPACPVGALYQEDGFVKLNRDNCVGCKICAMVCPFGAIVMVQEQAENKQGKRTNRSKALKCDLCFSRNNEVSKDNCACIQACPTKAMDLIDYETYRQGLLKARAKEIAKSRANL